MTSGPPDGQPRLPFFRTIAVPFENADREPVTGVRKIEPAADTRQSMRGNLYAAVDLIGDHPEPMRLIESLLSAIQRTYYTVKGSQSQVLVQAVREARLKIDGWNHDFPDRQLRAGMIAAAFLNGRLLVLQNGPAVALITSGDRIELYPGEVENAQADSLPDRPANWEIYRQEVDRSVGLFMGGSRWLDSVELRTIAGTVAHLSVENCRAAAAGLVSESARGDLPGLLFYAERSSTVPNLGSAAQRGTPLSPRRPGPPSRTAGLPTSVHAKPPVHDLPPPPQMADDEPIAPGAEAAQTAVPASLQPTDPVRPLQADAKATEQTQPGRRYDEHAGSADDGTVAPAAELPTAAAAAQEWADQDPWLDDLSDDTSQYGWDEDVADPAPSRMTRTLQGVSAGVAGAYARSRALMAGMLPERRQEVGSPNVYPAPMPRDEAPAAARRPSYAAVTERVSERVHDAVAATPTFSPPEPTTGSRQRLFLLLAILILLLVPTVTYAVSALRTDNRQLTEGQNLLEMAQVRLDNGLLALDSGDVDTARGMCLEGQSLLGDGITIVGRNERTAAMEEEITRCLDATMDTEYLFELTEPLVRFPGNAEPQRVLVGDEFIFILDTGRQRVDLYQLDGERRFVPDPMPIVALQEGQVIDGITVGRLVDIAWLPVIAGYQERASLLVLDRNNQIFRFDPRVDGATHVPVGQPVALQLPNQMEVYLGRTYFSDEGLDQILRYGIGRLEGQPDFWFAAETSANLNGVIRMAIDGDIWLLYNRGSLLRYNQGIQSPFSLGVGSVTAGQAVDMALGDEVYPSIYVADAAQDRILVFDKETGAYEFQWVAPEGDPLRDLRGLFMEPVDGNLYILTKAALYRHPLR